MERTLGKRGTRTGRLGRGLGFRPGRHIISRGNKPIGTRSVEVFTSATESRIAAVANGTIQIRLGMRRPLTVGSPVVLVTQGTTRIAGSPDAVIRNARDLGVLTAMAIIVRIGCLGILARIVVLLVGTRGMMVQVRMMTRRSPMPVPTTKNKNGTTGSLTRSGEASFSSQVIEFGGQEREGRKAI